MRTSTERKSRTYKINAFSILKVHLNVNNVCEVFSFHSLKHRMRCRYLRCAGSMRPEKIIINCKVTIDFCPSVRVVVFCILSYFTHSVVVKALSLRGTDGTSVSTNVARSTGITRSK